MEHIAVREDTPPQIKGTSSAVWAQCYLPHNTSERAPP